MSNSFRLTQVINEATRITSTNATTLIDNIYVTNTNYVKDTCISSLAFSDHFSDRFTWRAHCFKSPVQSKINHFVFVLLS